jgi:hypothetical protein
MAYCITAHSRLGLFLLSAAAAMAAEDLRQNQNRHFTRDSEDLVRLAREVFRAHSQGETSYSLTKNGQPCPTLLASITEALEYNDELYGYGTKRGPISASITVDAFNEAPP